jgi:hypothetical protein
VWWTAPNPGPPNAATLDHLVSRLEQPRGLGNPPRRPVVLACRQCNQARGALERVLRTMLAEAAAASGVSVVPAVDTSDGQG